MFLSHSFKKVFCAMCVYDTYMSHTTTDTVTVLLSKGLLIMSNGNDMLYFWASCVYFRMIITPFPSLTFKCTGDLVCIFEAFSIVSGVCNHCVVIHIWPNES